MKKNNSKILILSENLEVDRTSSGLRGNKHILLYARIYDVHVLTSTPLGRFEQIDGVKYYFINFKPNDDSIWLDKFPKYNALQNLLFGFNLKTLKKVRKWEKQVESIINSDKFDFVVTHGSGASFLPAYAMFRLNKKYNIKHLMFIHDPFPFNQYPPPYQQKNSLPYQSVARFFGKVLKSADILSFPSLRLKEWMQQYYNFIDHKYIIQPHIGLSIDELESILPDEGEEKVPHYPKGLNIVHTGTLLGPRSPLYLLKALEMLYDNYPETKSEVFLHVIGKMTKDWNAQDLIRDNVYIHPQRFSYLNSLKLQQNAEVLLLLEAKSDVSPFMPGKLADYLMAEKPILALTPKASETTRILGNDYPLLVENGNIEKIYEKLLLLYKSYKKDTLKNLIPSSDSYEYVLPKNWFKSLKILSK